MLLSDYRVDLGLLLTASPSLANVDLQLLLSIHSERPAWQKYCIAGATWVLRLWLRYSHANCLYNAISLLWWQFQGETCGGFLPTSKTSSTEQVGWEVLVWFSQYVRGFCHLRICPAFLWCLQKEGRSWPWNLLLSSMVAVPSEGSQGSQCTLHASDLLPAVNAASPFYHTLWHWNCHFEYNELVEMNLIILLNLVNLLRWRKENQCLLNPVQFCLSVVQEPKPVGDHGLHRQLSASRQERPCGWGGWCALRTRDQDWIPKSAVPSTVPYTNPVESKIWCIIYNLLLIPDRESIFFNSHNVSKPESSSVLTAVSTLDLFSSSMAVKLT